MDLNVKKSRCKYLKPQGEYQTREFLKNSTVNNNIDLINKQYNSKSSKLKPPLEERELIIIQSLLQRQTQAIQSI